MDEEDGHLVHAVKESDRQQRLRLCVLNETLNTERDYVRTLLFLQSAFLHRIRQTADDQQCLSPEHVKILFSNIEDILELHKEVLSSVEAILQPEPQPHHALGHVFLQFRERFSVYGEYCSNHEKALRLLMELNKIPHIRTFLLRWCEKQSSLVHPGKSPSSRGLWQDNKGKIQGRREPAVTTV